MAKKGSSTLLFRSLLVFCAFLSIGILGSPLSVRSQTGNTVDGHVFGANRRPVSDIQVELLDDLDRTIGRMRTNSSGRYSFSGLPPGRFKVHVMPFGTDYEEQVQEVEMVSFARGVGVDQRLVGATREQRDFYLRPRKGTSLDGALGTVFVQEVPPNAKKLYETAMQELQNKRLNEAYAALKAAIEVFPTYFDALERLGTEYVKAGHLDAAQVLLTMAIGVNPRAYKSYHGLAITFYLQKKYDEALVAVDKAIEIYAFAPESLVLAGSLLRQAKRYPEAEKRLLKAEEVGAGNVPDVHWELALLYGKGMERYRDAARELKLYLKAVPDHKDVETIRKLIDEFEKKAKSS